MFDQDASKLSSITGRNNRPAPWAEGDNIPWHDPDFSRRMLAEHLSQAHDAASRKFETIDCHVAWIHYQLLSGRPSRVVDLGCGPGLYAYRLARLGHSCTGIDYAPASIAYAVETAQESQLEIVYRLEDIRTAQFPPEQDLVMLIYGEPNVFAPADMRQILKRASASLTNSGQLLLEVHAPGVIRRRGQEERSWHAAESGLWSDAPHICLQENFWNAESKTAIVRHYVIDAASGDTRFESASYQDYAEDEYHSLLVDSGFTTVSHYPSLSGIEDEQQQDFMVIVASK